MSNILLQLPDGSITVASSVAEMAPIAQGAIPLHDDHTPYSVDYLPEQDGYLIDGLPINVVIEGSWRPGQQEVMAQLWNSGAVPRPAAAVLALPVIEDTNWLLYGGLAVAALFLFWPNKVKQLIPSL